MTGDQAPRTRRERNLRTRTWLGPLVGVLLALTACTGTTVDGESTSPSAPVGVPVDLPVSNWSAQSGSSFGLSLSGTLVQNGACIRLRVDDGSSVTPVWPAGHSAYQDADGITVIDGQGREVARTGQRIDYVGGYAEAPYPNACTESGDGTFLIQEDIVRGY